MRQVPWMLLATSLLICGCEFHQRQMPVGVNQPAASTASTSSSAVGEPAAAAVANTASRNVTPASDPAANSEPSDPPESITAAEKNSAAGKNSATEKKPLPIESTSRRAVGRADGIEVITFDDLNIGMQADMAFRDFLLTERVKELDGQKVRLIGYMHGGVSQIKDLSEFVLLQNLQCKFGPGGQADHLVRVMVKPGVEASYSTGAVQVEGVLKIVPYQGPDGNTWSVYDLVGEQVKVIRK
jgi:hypothetical protein